MKVFFMTVILSLLIFQLNAQSSGCWALKIQKNGLNDPSDLSEHYSDDGMYLKKNGIYNFEIQGKEYSMYRIQNIDSEGITICFATEDEPVLTFKPDDIDELTFYSIDDGKTGILQSKIKKRKYEFTMVKKSQGCMVDKSKICKNRDCDDFIEGYNYMTAGNGWKPVYEQNGTTFMLDKTVLHEIKKD